MTASRSWKRPGRHRAPGWEENDYRIRHKDLTWRVLESIAGTIRNERGDVAKLVIVNPDITDRKGAEEQAEHNSRLDCLRGLPNRRLFLDRLKHLFDRAQRNPEGQYVLVFVDLDGFKTLNETIGPTLGDHVIIEIGRRIESRLRGEDRVSRPQTSSLTEMQFSPEWAEMNLPFCSKA